MNTYTSSKPVIGINKTSNKICITCYAQVNMNTITSFPQLHLIDTDQG